MSRLTRFLLRADEAADLGERNPELIDPGSRVAVSEQLAGPIPL
jgi:hypothetical protein